MSLGHCPDCNHPISSRAYSCPHCGKPFRKTLGQWVLWVIVAVVLGIIVFNMSVCVGIRLGS